MSGTRRLAIEYCRNMVRRHDHDGYLCSLLYPSRQSMEAQWALRAFSLETARVRESVSNDTLGRIRFQWWKDSIDALYTGSKGAAVPDNPVLQALDSVLQETELSKSWFIKVLNARDSDLTIAQYMSMDALVDYCEQSHSSLLYLSLESLNIRELDQDHVASHLGKTIGLVTLLKSLPYLASNNLFILPASLCAQHSLSVPEACRYLQTVFHPDNQPNNNSSNNFKADKSELKSSIDNEKLQETGEKLKRVVYEVATTAYRHYETAKDHLNSQSRPSNASIDDCGPAGGTRKLQAAFPVFLNALPASVYLRQCEENDFDLVQTFKANRLSQWKLPFSLLYTSIYSKTLP